MFFRVDTIKLQSMRVEQLRNPANLGQPMELSFIHTEMATALMVVTSNKVVGEFRDLSTNRKIPKRRWSPEMAALYEEQLKALPPVKKKLKVTVIGYVFLALFVYVIGMSINSIRKDFANIQKPKLTEPVKKGDLYFGRFAELTPEGSRLREGHAWFKVDDIQGDVYLIRLGKDISKEYVRDEKTLSSASFGKEVYRTTIRSQKDYEIDFRTDGSQMSFWANAKKPKNP